MMLSLLGNRGNVVDIEFELNGKDLSKRAVQMELLEAIGKGMETMILRDMIHDFPERLHPISGDHTA